MNMICSAPPKKVDYKHYIFHFVATRFITGIFLQLYFYDGKNDLK